MMAEIDSTSNIGIWKVLAKFPPLWAFASPSCTSPPLTHQSSLFLSCHWSFPSFSPCPSPCSSSCSYLCSPPCSIPSSSPFSFRVPLHVPLHIPFLCPLWLSVSASLRVSNRLFSRRSSVREPSQTRSAWDGSRGIWILCEIPRPCLKSGETPGPLESGHSDSRILEETSEKPVLHCRRLLIRGKCSQNNLPRPSTEGSWI